jgi:hypothetical protein
MMFFRSVRLIVAGALVALGCAAAAPAAAQVQISVDKSAQQMTVTVDGEVRHVWRVSTARSGYRTPTGTWRPTRLHASWYSRKYDNAPMPHSIFFVGGYAIHGTYETGKLGRPASRGCVRLSPSNARTLFALVQQNRGETTISIQGSSPDTVIAQKRKRRATPTDVAVRSTPTQKPMAVAARAAPKPAAPAWNGRERTMPASALGYGTRGDTRVWSPQFWMLR